MQSTNAASTGSHFEDQCRGLPCCPGAVVHPFVHPFGRDGQIPSHELDGSPPLNSQNTTEANHVDTPVRSFKVVARVRIPLGVLQVLGRVTGPDDEPQPHGRASPARVARARDAELVAAHGKREHGIGLERSRTASPGMVDRRGCKGVSDASPPVALPGDKTRHRPDIVVRLVLVSAAPDGTHLQQARICRAWFCGHPADRLLPQVGDETRSAGGTRVVTVGLLAEFLPSLLVADRFPIFVERLVGLAVAVSRVVRGSEDRLQIVPRGFVGGEGSSADRQ